MDAVKRKVYLDLFASPWNLLPVAGGLTALMASWAVGGDPTLTMAGVGGVLAGIGITASRLIWGVEALTERAYGYQLEQQQHLHQQQLDELDEQLTRDRDPRTQSCLRELRGLIASLETKAESGKITGASFEILDSVGKVFDECVKQLRHSHELWETSRSMRGPARDSILQQRDEVVRDVCETAHHVGETIEQFLHSTTTQNRTDLSRVRSELDETIAAARRAEARTAEIERAAKRGLVE